MLEAAEAHGIYVMLTIQNHGPFSLEENTQWADNPYNAENGGPLNHPLEFFTDDTARELFRQRLRYVVARWGWSTHLLAWELWNEINLVANALDPDVVAWHQEMARELLALDPYDHMVSTSVSLGSEQSPLWALPEIAFTQSHTYNWPLLWDTADSALHLLGADPCAGQADAHRRDRAPTTAGRRRPSPRTRPTSASTTGSGSASSPRPSAPA